MSSQLTNTSTLSRPAPRGSSQRARTIDLETQSAYKFALAVLLGVGAVVATIPVLGSAALVVVGVVLAARSLAVLAADQQSGRRLRPREFATWDGALAVLLAAIAIALVIDGALAGAALSGVAAIALAALRLRTRYVTQ